ncbi:MAG: ABC transporter ATP-binding protein [Sphaerochaetaceae bacterium]|nr:ABC transporter ATP-binding protein [Sphaerochaetaceae bacterium]
MSANDSILSCNNLCMYFGGVKAVDAFSMDVKEGVTYGIIGPNGAGKTTIYNVFTRIYAQTSGTISFCGQCIDSKDQVAVARMGMSRTFQNIRLFSGLSVLDNVKVALDYSGKYTIAEAILHLPRRQKAEKEIAQKAMDTLKLLKLDQYAYHSATSLPYGIQRRVEIARALVSQPKVLLLDEPAAGLNPEEVLQLVDFLKEIKSLYPKLALLVIEHRMDLVMNLCDYLYVQNFGRTIAQGVPAEIQTNPVVLSAYLGEEE